MPRLRQLESYDAHLINPQILGAWLRGLKLGGKTQFTIAEIEEGLIVLCDAMQPAHGFAERD